MHDAGPLPVASRTQLVGSIRDVIGSDRYDRAIVGVLLPAHGLIHTYELSIPLFVAVWLDHFEVTEASIGLIVATGYVPFGIGALPVESYLKRTNHAR